MTFFLTPSKTLLLILISNYHHISKNIKLVLFILQRISILDVNNLVHEPSFEDLSIEIKSMDKATHTFMIETVNLTRISILLWV